MHILQEVPTTTILCAKCANTISVNVGTPELILRARSEYTPFTTDETSALSYNLERAYDDLRRCEREIACLEGTLHALRQSQSALQLTTECINALLSPVRKLPTELLREIASYTLPSRWWTDRIAKHPWNFTQVCRSWRSAAISITWAWAQIRFPDWPHTQIANRCDSIRSAVWRYLMRAAQTHSPLRILGLRDAHLRDGWIEVLLSVHSECIHTLEMTTRDDKLPFTYHLPTLQRLIVHGELLEKVDAPDIRIVDLYGANPHNIQLPWANLRAFKMRRYISTKDLEVLCACTQLEVLSLSDEIMGIQYDSDPLVLPALHTLEIGGAAAEVCPHLVAPNLQHFILNMASDDNYTWHVELHRPALQLLEGVLPPVTSLTLRNMDTYDFENIPVRELLAMPRALRKVSAVVETDYPLQSSTQMMYRDLVEVLCWDEACPTLPHLTEVDLVGGMRDIPWSSEDVALVMRLLESRASGGATGGCARLERLNIRTPFAPCPIATPAEPGGAVRNLNGQSVVSIDMQCLGEPVEGFDIEAALR
ncbi:uncharacterized protein SCHCODRAFT_02196175 [Schizophyllum commune H4-8]|nr:uncharacterized protein SCHCODRAFT_02196175 [Schizophyllum commune H4-8]KAI5896660.1 hypothetical protein SCHCODRAFT_02196175 [Schizophyllum commune H4-8]